MDTLVAQDAAWRRRIRAARHEATTLESQEAYSLAKTGFVVAVLNRAIRQGLLRAAPSDG